MLLRIGMIFYGSPFVSHRWLKIEFFAFVLTVGTIMLPTEQTKHAITFQIYQPVYACLLTESQTLVNYPVMLKFNLSSDLTITPGISTLIVGMKI